LTAGGFQVTAIDPVSQFFRAAITMDGTTWRGALASHAAVPLARGAPDGI
jgi:hypothetical protein